MGVADRYNKKKKKTGVSTSSSSTENTGVAGRYSAKFAPTKEDLTEQEKKDGGWFKAPLFDDGYDFGDVSRTILGTFTDVEENVHTAVFDATENLIDTVAYGVGAVGGLFSDDFQEGVGDFIAKDLLHSKEAGEFLGKTTPHGLLNMIVNGDTEDASVLGDKSDQMVQSASHLVGQAALQIVGVPWWVTAGVNSFGSEIESAFQQDATYGEAGLSGAISAGAEILTEKISGGIKFGGKALDDVVTDKLAKGISNKVVKSLVKFGWDAAGEGGEEILSGAISAIGQKITYADDKELNELFSSEDAWDAFIGGAVLGGGNSAINSVKNSQGGRDPISALTDNEQKVLDSVYNERVAEAEKDGKTLTKKEKNEIYDQVQEELKKGYISTDTIESVLGGDTYKSYKDTVDGEEAILKEYEELGNKTNPTLKEQARYAELQAKVKEIEGNSQRSQLKSQLSEEVYGQLTRDVKGKTQTDNYLLESYNEQTRRGQAFEADVSKYKGKQAEVIQKAIDSGILNNTNRTHEFVDMLAKLSADKGVLFDFANNEKIKSSGFAVDGKTVNGFVTKDGVTLNIQSSKALNTVVGHEITHVLEGTELYTALQEAVTEYARTKGEYDSRYKALEELYKNVEGADINAELTADLIGDYLFTDQDFVNNLSVKNRNVFQKIYDEIKYLCKVATAGSKEARELEKVKRAFDKAYKESGTAQGETKYSFSENNKKSLDKYTQKQYNDFGWARDTEAITKNELDDMYSKINVKGSLNKFPQSSSGEAIIELNDNPHTTLGVDNVFVFVTGTKNNPQINKVARFQVETDTEMEIIKEKLYERGSFSNTYYSFLKQYGFAREYSKKSALDYTGYEEKVWRRSGGTESDRAYGNRGIEQNGSGTFEQTQSNEIAPINKASSTDGVFFDGKNRKYSLSEDSEGRKLSDEQSAYFNGSKVVDDNGNLKAVYHGSPADFNTFSLEYLGTNGTNEGYGFYFTDSKRIAEGYSKGREGQQNGETGKLFEVYLDIKKPLSDTEVTMSRAEFKKLLIELNKQVDEDGEPLEFLANYGDVEWEGLNKVLNYAMEIEYDGSDNDVNMVHSIINACGNKELVFDLLRKVTGYDGIIVNEATWGGDQTIYIAFHPEQIKNVDNKKPTTNPDIHYSLSAEGEAPKRYGNYNVSGKDIAFEAPIQEDIAKNATPTEETAEQAADFAPISKEEVNAMFPNEPNLFDLENEAKSLEEQIRKSYEEKDVDTLEKALAEYNALQEKIKQTKAEEKAHNSEILSSLDDTDAPPEMEAPYYETRDTAPLSENDVTAIAEGVQSILGFDKSEMPKMREIIQKHATAETPNYEALYNDVKESFGSFEDVVWVDELLPDIKKQIRKYRFKQSDFIKGEMAYLNDGKYGDFRKRYFGKFMLTKDGQSIDTIYGELNELYPEHFPSDIDNSAEQLLRIVEVVDSKGEEYAEYEIDDETIREVTDDIIRKISNARTIEAESFAEEERKALFEHADDFAPMAENTAPKAESEAATAEDEASATIDEILSAPIGEEAKAKHESKTANILTEEPETPKKKDRLWSKFKTNFVDKGSVFEKLSLKTKNRELMSKWNYTLYSEARAQRLMGNGTEGVKSLNDIRAEVEKSGRTKDFYEYLYHKHNVDRMSLESKAAPTIEALNGKFGHLKIAQVRAIAAHKITEKTTEKTAQTVREAKEYLNAIETKNKPVFGFDVTAEQSQEIVDQYEVANPEFKEYAQDVYTYMNYLRGQMVESGVISQETADLWANMYPHYVPIRRAGDAGIAVNVPLDTGKTGINAPIKRATGGNRDILPLFDTMAMRTEQTYKAIARNNFGVELKNTLGSTIESNATNLDDVIDSIDIQDGLLQEGKNGQNPTFTVFENGERVTFEITEDMYEALKPTSDGLRTTVKPLNKASKWHRGILTEYNPVFMATNAIKDVQDILINSQHPAQTYKNLPKAIKELSIKGKWYTEYMENGGEQNTYFDGQTNTFKAEDKGFVKTFGMPIRAIKAANNFVERAPRLAEYIASREAGESVETAMLNSARVTTNFAAGGDVTKFLDRNGATFLNASVQGFNQQVRNIKEAKANGLKGWVGLAAKVAIAGLPAILLNNLVWDDDEEYEELSDYVKDNYYIVAKYGDGKFVRIPKGRTVAVIQNAFTQVSNTATGDDEADFNRFFDLFLTNLSPNNPIDNNILSPIVDVAQNEAWYGGDLVPTRLQDLPAAEQYDESTDSISKWLGEKINVSPYKINYLLDQYSGGIGDVVLPMLTPEAENGGVFAPLADKFTTDSVMKNQNVSDFYDTADELTANANSSKATTEDILKSKYINAVSAEMSDLYKEKREIQNSDMSDDEKREAVRDIQRQIDELAKEGLNSYNDMTIYNGFATVGDKLYKRNKDGEWEKISEKQREKQEEVTEELGIDPATYWGNKSEYDFAYEYPEKYAVAKAIGGYEAYKTYSSELYDIKADKDENGKSISGSRKEKVIEYINGIDADYYERIILFKNEYNADDTYNYEILEYLNSREDISYEEMVAILKELGFEIGSDGVSVTW